MGKPLACLMAQTKHRTTCADGAAASRAVAEDTAKENRTHGYVRTFSLRSARFTYRLDVVSVRRKGHFRRCHSYEPAEPLD